MNLRFYKSYLGIILIFLLYSCSSDKKEIITYEISPSVDPNTSLDCTGVWANSPLCKERNEALVELKKLEPLYQSFKVVDDAQAKEILNEVEILKKNGDKFYFDEFYFKSRDSYKDAFDLIVGYNDRNKLKVLELIDRANLAFDLIKLDEAKSLILDGLSIDPSNKELNYLNNRVDNYQNVSNLISSAKEYSFSNEYDLALKTINEALNIDPERIDSIQTKQKLVNDSRSYFFDQNLKNAYKALSLNDFSNSISLFEEAKSLLPNNPELPILKREIDIKKKQYDIILFSESGDRSYSSESWEAALDAYKNALALDPTNSDLTAKFNRTSALKNTYDDLSKYLRNIDRLSSPNIRNNFKKSLDIANKINLDTENNLIDLINNANQIFKKYGEMIVLNLISNNETFVDIQKTRQYQPFTEENIKLYPGKFVIVAKKRGMQSFRKEIYLEPGKEFLSITAICSNKCNIFETESVTKEDIDVSNIEEQEQGLANNQSQNNTNNNFISNAKIIGSSFSKNIKCTKTTRNRSLRLAFTLNVDKSGKVVSSKVSSIRDETTKQQAKNLRVDDRAVIVIIEKALKKSKFVVPKVNGQPQTGKINHVVRVPADFCVT
tara:strand:- start:6104 stop:7927 length:1824 start_codon:yes stop_codon:yes gene_type:complete